MRCASPTSRVVGIDVSETSVRHTEALKRKYNLGNLEVYRLPVERVGDLSRRFDKIVCTGVLHHLPAPEEGLCALRAMLQPDGAMDLMVYAPYGRAGVYMLQEYCRRLGIGHTDQEIRVLAVTLAALPPHHPLARLLAESPDFQHKDALADALLHPQDRAYSVPQLFDLIEGCGLKFGRWVRQAPYLPGCGRLGRNTPCRQTYGAAAAGAVCRGRAVPGDDAAPQPDRPPGRQPRWRPAAPFRRRRVAGLCPDPAAGDDPCAGAAASGCGGGAHQPGPHRYGPVSSGR